MYSEFPNPILVLDTTLEGMFWTPFSCRHKMTCSQRPPPTSSSVACSTRCWEMRPRYLLCKAKLDRSRPPKSGQTFLACSLKCSWPQELWMYTAALPVLLALLGASCSGWENSSPLGKRGEKCTMGEACKLWTLYLCFWLFFSLVSGWEEFRDDKILACCLLKTKLRNPRMTLLYLHTILWVCFYA